MKKILCLLLSFVVLILPLCGCSSSPDSFTDEMFALDTIIRFTLFDDDKDKCKSVIDDCKAEILRLENLLSATKEGSDIYRINNASSQSVTVDDETAQLIQKACEISRLTGGAFDISIRPLMSIWGFDTKEYRVPQSSEIEKALELVNYENISIDGNEITLKDGMTVDLGATAKGYIGDKVLEVLNNSSVYSAIVDMGGMIITKGSGKSENDHYWNIGVEYPDDSNSCFFSFDCDYDAVSTSGGYQRYFEKDGERYHHILDSSTGKPSDSDISSVTVIGEKGYECDALSTAFFVMGVDKTVEYLNSHKMSYDNRYRVVILSADKKTMYLSKEFETDGIRHELLAPYNKDIEIVYI